MTIFRMRVEKKCVVCFCYILKSRGEEVVFWQVGRCIVVEGSIYLEVGTICMCVC